MVGRALDCGPNSCWRCRNFWLPSLGDLVTEILTQLSSIYGQIFTLSQVLDCSTDFRWITHWDGQSGCCNAVDAPYVTRTGQIAIDGDFGPLNQGDFFEIALDGELFDIVEINGGNFVNIENIQENAWRFFVDTDAFNGQSRSIEKGGGGTGIFANYQFYFIGANSFVKPQCKWIQLCRTPTAETTTQVEIGKETIGSKHVIHCFCFEK